MSFKLVFPHKEKETKPDLANRIRKTFGLDFGFISSIPITVIFKRTDGTMTAGINMAFDTGAGISHSPKYVSNLARGVQVNLQKRVAKPITVSMLNNIQRCSQS